MPKKKKRSRGITVTVKKAPWQVKLERRAKQVRSLAWNALALVGLIAVIVLITRG